MPAVFISFAWEDREFVERLRDDLQREGVASEPLAAAAPGDSVAAHLARAIAHAAAVIVVLSAAAARSPWVSTEVALALSRELRDGEVRILPVLAEPHAPVPPLLADRRYADLSTPAAYRQNLPALAAAVREAGAAGVKRANVGEVDAARAAVLDAARVALLEEKSTYEARLVRRSAGAAMLATFLAALTAVASVLVGLVASLPTVSRATIDGTSHESWIIPALGVIAVALAVVSAAIGYSVGRGRTGGAGR